MWSFNYAPQIHWPLSGAVVQDIAPALLQCAGDAQVERRVLGEVASYGKQIGVLTDLLCELAALVPAEALGDKGRHALTQLTELRAKVEALKPL